MHYKAAIIGCGKTGRTNPFNLHVAEAFQLIRSITQIKGAEA
jgi:hypothetical protein